MCDERSSDSFMINGALSAMAQNDELRSRILSSNVVKHCANVLSTDLIWEDPFFEFSLPVLFIRTFIKYVYLNPTSDDGRKEFLSSGIFDAVANHIFTNEKAVKHTLKRLYFWVPFLAIMLQYDVVRAQMKTFDFKSFFKSVLSLKPGNNYIRANILDLLSEFDEIRSQIPAQETHTLIGRCLKSDHQHIREYAPRLQAVLARCDEPQAISKGNDGPQGLPPSASSAV
ncbi:hypothetical protein BU17DRAFT_67174 [Hysterangium stoloniferum]|nr:hypothetical protein BU17DRAFT_67174 [Hysterangium stoloniferum]